MAIMWVGSEEEPAFFVGLRLAGNKTSENDVATVLEDKLTTLLTPLLEAEGYDLVQLAMLGEGRGTVLQILVEDPATQTIDLDSCSKLSRTVGTHLEVENAITGAYRLEISSPGIDRPLTKPAHYGRYVGFEVKIETHLPRDGQKRYHGKILSADDTSVTIETETKTKTVTLPFADIARAKLKLTDDLIRAARPTTLSTNDNPDVDDHKGEMKK